MSEQEPDIDRVMIIGAGGRVGAELCRAYPEDTFFPRTRETLDIRNAESVKIGIANALPAVVVNVATAHRSESLEEHWAINVRGAMNVFNVCGELKIPLIHVTTGDVFGGFFGEQHSFGENDPCYAPSPKLATKLAAEHAQLSKFHAKRSDYFRGGFKFYLVRTSMLFSNPAFGYTGGFVHDLTNSLDARKEETPLPVDTMRSPTYVPWLVEQLKWLIENRRGVQDGIYHICSTGAASLYDIACHIAARVHRRGGEIKKGSHHEYLARQKAAASSIARHAPLSNDKWAALRGIKLPTWQEQLSRFIAAGAK